MAQKLPMRRSLRLAQKASKDHEFQLLEAQKASKAPEMQLLNLPMEILEMILLEVVLLDGDGAYMSLSLTCSSFRSIVNRDLFRQKAHYEWLDSVVNWEKWSERSRIELRVPFEINQCRICQSLFKTYSGFSGNGKRGCLRVFYVDVEDKTCCFTCQVEYDWENLKLMESLTS